MNKQTFEDYLREVHCRENSRILDDDLPDHFDNWIGELGKEDLIKYADEYATRTKKEFLEWVDLEIETVMKILKK